jgi:hypothetical protein
MTIVPGYFITSKKIELVFLWLISHTRRLAGDGIIRSERPTRPQVLIL